MGRLADSIDLAAARFEAPSYVTQLLPDGAGGLREPQDAVVAVYPERVRPVHLALHAQEHAARLAVQLQRPASVVRAHLVRAHILRKSVPSANAHPAV